jgi:hypothetical protein
MICFHPKVTVGWLLVIGIMGYRSGGALREKGSGFSG